MSANGHDPQAAVRTYLTIFGALGFLTILTVGVAYMNLPPGPGVVIALVIALAKVFLIGTFFMHLKDEGRLINVSLGVCLGLVMILLVFVLPDLGIHELETLQAEEAAKRNPYVQMHEATMAGHGTADGGH
ncbi:MAG: cytochrome C oxidase subunit IV family protein [Candidatus Binatia bacterium]|nr:cytochrome C oxidase subunit IV family protein [Candidatus Binatia bacterium]